MALAATFFIHVALVMVLVRAFAPRLADTVADTVVRTFLIPVPPASRPKPAPSTALTPADDGKAGAPGKKASPRAAEAPRAEIAVKPTQAPPVQGPGRDDASGARSSGQGTGAAGAGQGTGSGTGGTGQGGGGTPTVKIEGDISSARDYPRASRDVRIGTSVMIDLTVGVDGRVKACRVAQASPDPAADRITCELATRRFRFRPALDAAGQPREALYRWRQRWFY